ncbi:hypothetical protein B0H17DRAFT_948257 [Mycena rosella]|uniref:F-box domain-containing protein n=1 Tax=Mycena rosella TaxID=1033263 RepID=A0AAD7D015_MYCRO|nr:hypothetical protein B0H17DRAFT_948257 [Mycena rosella]
MDAPAVTPQASIIETQELFDMIIDFLHASPADLLSCALVCFSWRPSAQLHIFRDVRISPGLDYYREYRTLPATDTIQQVISRLRQILRCPATLYSSYPARPESCRRRRPRGSRRTRDGAIHSSERHRCVLFPRIPERPDRF